MQITRNLLDEIAESKKSAQTTRDDVLGGWRLVRETERIPANAQMIVGHDSPVGWVPVPHWMIGKTPSDCRALPNTEWRIPRDSFTGFVGDF